MTTIPTTDEIIAAVARHYATCPELMLMRERGHLSRRPDLVAARACACAVMRRVRRHMSLPDIAREIGASSHTTVLRALQIADPKAVDAVLQALAMPVQHRPVPYVTPDVVISEIGEIADVTTSSPKAGPSRWTPGAVRRMQAAARAQREQD
jgi:hypothetical protein